jgi:hypothetical protein
MEVQLHAFLTTTLDGVNGHLHGGPLYNHYPKNEKKVGFTAGLYASRERKLHKP